MNENDRIGEDIHPNFYGGINQSRLKEAIDFDQAGFYTRESLRAKTLQNQQNQLENDDYQKLKLNLAQEGLDDITAINQRWEKRLGELKVESQKKYVKFVLTSLVVLVTLIFLSIILGIPEVAVLSFLLLIVILPRNKPIIDTKDLLLWNLFRDNRNK